MGNYRYDDDRDSEDKQRRAKGGSGGNGRFDISPGTYFIIIILLETQVLVQFIVHNIHIIK